MSVSRFLSGAFASVTHLTHSLDNWWSERTFWLYYYGMSQDPRDLLNSLPLSQPMLDRVCGGIETWRGNMLMTSTASAASGYQARPSYGNILTGFSNSLKPALDIALRTGINTPVRFALIGLATLLICDYLSGGHLRDAAAQLANSLTPESHAQDNREAEDEKNARRFYAPPSIS